MPMHAICHACATVCHMANHALRILICQRPKRPPAQAYVLLLSRWMQV
jgi:hypothetical protein